MQNAIEAHVLGRHPELAQSPVNDRGKGRERLKSRTREQAMRARTGEPSRKETLKSQLHGFFGEARSHEELRRRLAAEG